MARNMMRNHSDMQDKYCGRCSDIHPMQSQYKANPKEVPRPKAAQLLLWSLSLSKANVVSVTTIFVFVLIPQASVP